MSCGGVDETLWYTADWDVWLKLAAIGPTYYHNVATTAFRIHGGSLTATGSRDVLEFEQQLQTVLMRHVNRHGGCSPAVARAARVSILVNVSLAAASAGKLAGMRKAASSILGLGLPGAVRYFRDSRLLERILPRLKARIKGTF